MDRIPKHILYKIREAKEKHLEELDLSNNPKTSYRNKLTKIPEQVFELQNLRILKLKNHQIYKLSRNIIKLKNLTLLDLSNNNFSYLPRFLGKLNKLTLLDLSKNKISYLPESLCKINEIIYLNLAYNQLSYLPNFIGDLDNLKYLNLQNNNLSAVPKSIFNLTNLKKLYLANNPLLEPPIEIVHQGIEAIRNYFWQLEEKGIDYIYEAKLIIIGEGGAGKTTLAKKIDNPNYQLKEQEKSTQGIDVSKYSFLILDKEENIREFTINIWDFGGQEIYHATHQFFLTKRSLYTLVADTRKEDTDFYYWLNVVELLSNNSPLLIIKNEKQDRQRDINETALRKQFTNLEKTFATNLATNRGLDEIIVNIEHYIQKLSHIGETLPKTWVKVREALEQDTRNYISLQEYLDICEENGFTRHEYKLQLSQYLHDLGVCLHFQDEEDSILYKTIILKPEWGTDAVYKVLDNKQVVNNQGRFSRNDLKNIWYEEKYASMRGELLELMKKFQLCYEIPYSKDNFIAPQLLSENQPEYKWNKNNNLILRYAYPDFMPKGIITRFIVAMHQYIDEQKYVWKTGVIFNQDNQDQTKAQVIEYYGKREIIIRVCGKNKRDFITIISHELDKINNSFKRLKYQKLIPCNCSSCKNSHNPFAYEFNKLLERLNNNKLTVECGNPPYDDVQVLGLIDNTIDIQQLTTQGKLSSHKSFNFNGDIRQLVLPLLEQGNFSGNIMPENRNINTQGGNYNENIEGNYYDQRSNANTIENINQSHSGSGDNVGGDKNTTHIYNSQDLAQAAADIQALLEQLEKTYPTNTFAGKVAIANETIQQIDNNPNLTLKILSAIKAGGTSALDSLLDHPAASFVIGALEDWQQSK